MSIQIEDLEIWCQIGVTPQERSWPQKILISLTISVPAPEKDDISETTDYASVVDSIRQEASRYPRNLIETLALDICKKIQQTHFTTPTRITIKKFVIPSSSAIVLEYNPEIIHS